MSSVSAIPTSEVERTAARLRMAALACLAAMPLAMAIANRSSILVLTLAAFCALGAALTDGCWRIPLATARSALASSLGRACVAFLAYALASVLWSSFPALALHALGEFTLPVIAALAVGCLLPRPWPRWALAALALSFAVACVLILGELATGLALRRALGMRWNSFIFNRSVLTLLVLAPALLWFLLRERRPLFRLLAVATAGLLALVLLQSESGAAVLGAVAALGGAGLALLPRRIALGLSGAGLAAALLLAPIQGDLAGQILPPRMHETLASSNSQSRVAIWQSFGAAVREAPWIGSGFGASAHLERTPVAAQVSAEKRVLLGAGHPHSAALQIWVELGLVGAAMALVVLICLLAQMRRLPRDQFAAAMALLAAVAAVSQVGHGAWQGWWPAAIGAGILALRGAPLNKAPCHRES